MYHSTTSGFLLGRAICTVCSAVEMFLIIPFLLFMSSKTEGPEEGAMDWNHFDVTLLISTWLQINPDCLASLGFGSIPSSEALHICLLLVPLPMLLSRCFKPKCHELSVSNMSDHGWRQSVQLVY
jgi:hypothetical protein